MAIERTRHYRIGRRAFLIRAPVLFVAGGCYANGVFRDHRRLAFQPAPAGGACDTTQDNNTGAEVANQNIGNPGREYVAHMFTAGATYTACKVMVPLKAVASPTGTIRFGIWATSGSAPTTQIGSWSDTLDASTLTASHVEYTFENMSASLSSGTEYGLVANTSFSDWTNYARWSCTASTGGNMDQSADGSSWSAASDKVAEFTLYST